MSGGSIKLATLLNDVADRPEGPAASRVSLNLLQDAGTPSQKRAWQKHLPKVAAAFASIIILGVLVHLISELKFTAPARQAPVPQVQTNQPAKAKQEETPLAGIDRSAFSKPVQELMQYVDDLKAGRVAFKLGISGEDAAKQLGFSRLFASAYEEMIIRAKARETKQRTRPNVIIAGFEAIVGEEQKIDQLLAQKERHAAAIAYLRALQNGDVLFPGPQALAPAPPVLLIQLISAYPDIDIDIDDPLFAAVYRETREFAAERLTNAGAVFAHEIIAEIRRLIVNSATRQATNSPPTMCEKGEAVGKLTTLARACPRLRLSGAAVKLSKEVAQQQSGVDCQNKAATNLKARLDAMSASEIVETCERAQLHIQTGTTDFLEMAN